MKKKIYVVDKNVCRGPTNPFFTSHAQMQHSDVSLSCLHFSAQYCFCECYDMNVIRLASKSPSDMFELVTFIPANRYCKKPHCRPAQSICSTFLSHLIQDRDGSDFFFLRNSISMMNLFPSLITNIFLISILNLWKCFISILCIGSVWLVEFEIVQCGAHVD